MKYKTIIETDDFKNFEFFEDGNGKYIHGIDAGAVNNEWIALYFTECEQEPKTVLYSGDGYADGYMVYDMAECPNCGYEYEDGDKDWGLSYCPNCGQKLNWERSE